MFDEMDRLRECAELARLLARYAELSQDDREVWQDRLADLDGLHGRELSRLYGELLAHGWLEQNTGLTPVLQAGRHAACYRVTSAGQKALKQLRRERRAGAAAGVGAEAEVAGSGETADAPQAVIAPV